MAQSRPRERTSNGVSTQAREQVYPASRHGHLRGPSPRRLAPPLPDEIGSASSVMRRSRTRRERHRCNQQRLGKAARPESRRDRQHRAAQKPGPSARRSTVAPVVRETKAHGSRHSGLDGPRSWPEPSGRSDKVSYVSSKPEYAKPTHGEPGNRRGPGNGWVSHTHELT